MTETEKFRTERLVARSWEIEDLSLAMELWGDPPVTALIDSRGKLTQDQVGEKLRAEIERERSGGVQYWALFDRRNGEFVGCGGLRPWVYTPGEANFEVGFHLVKRCWGQGFATEAALGALEYAWEKFRLSKVYAGHHPDNRASEKILKKLGFAFIGNVFYEPTGLMHPSYVCKKRRPRAGTPPHRRSAEFPPDGREISYAREAVVQEDATDLDEYIRSATKTRNSG